MYNEDGADGAGVIFWLGLGLFMCLILAFAAAASFPH